MSLEEYRYKVSALNKEHTNQGEQTKNLFSKYKKYIIIIVIVLLILILFKPGFVQGKELVNDKLKSNGKINVGSLLKYWIIFSLILCALLYAYCVICKKKSESGGSCKRCGN